MRRERREREFTEFYAGSAAALRRTAYVVVRDWQSPDPGRWTPACPTAADRVRVAH
jgi:hypothetical protein